ncbi:hypothetical protein LTR97_004659 [Elasticomyces elasticus]|uniref:Uncharacterized protein n=1 Tax=Elasticomyces elasticus TaxID=574655 RepID=A0AAN7W724_9PEZI|nr:hypothetical protein LTR97_004659 [Elasticomyces elasticus]
MAHNFCCAHPQQRIDSPEPPSRPPLKIDGLLAAAVLPEGHPHALSIPDKKPELDSSIIRSPHITDKLRWQFRRKSTKLLRSDEQYDSDAQPLSSMEVVNNIGEETAEEPTPETSLLHDQQKSLSVRALSSPASLDSYELRNKVRDSVLQSLGWLRPMLERPASIVTTENVVVKASAPPALLPPPRPATQSISSPNLLFGGQDLHTPLRRTQSSLNFGTLLKVPKLRSARNSVTTGSSETLRQESTDALQHVDTDDQISMVQFIKEGQEAAIAEETLARGAETVVATSAGPSQWLSGPRLHTMDISNQLRSMSALSEVSEEGQSLLSANDSWNFHCREKSGVSGFSNRSRYARMQSHLDVHAEDVAGSERVRSPVPSSNYSRPSSYFEVQPIEANLAGKVLQSHELHGTSSLDGATPDWPLPVISINTHTTASNTAQVGLEQQAQASPAQEVSGSTSFVTAQGDDEASLKWSSPLGHGDLPSKDSSSHISMSSVRSRLRERFTSTKKVVRKRRSIFKFLRPGSRRHQGRSVSSPMLRTKASRTFAFDGPSEDPGSVMVEYELTENPQDVAQPPRSASASYLEDRRATPALLAVPTATSERRPSLADYERTLTAAGDDRRRPSTLNVQKLQEVQDDDRKQSISLRRKLSRAKPLDDQPSSLMAQALQKHQEEKSLFRSASKQREERGLSNTEPGGPFDTASAGGSSLSAGDPNVQCEVLGPLDQPTAKILVGRSTSTSYIVPPKPVEGRSTVSEAVAGTSPPSPTVPSTKSRTPVQQGRWNIDEDSPSSPTSATRIGTSMASWARYPSHTRAERNGPAGRPDAVTPHDFASDADAAERGESQDVQGVSKKSGKAKTTVAKRRSTMFSGIGRYYSNVFSSGSSPQNRRSSIAASGWLAQPDLEMLPPPTSSEPTYLHQDFKQHLHNVEHKLEEVVKKELRYVEEEAVKLEVHVRTDIEEIEEEAEKLMHMKPQHHQGPGPGASNRLFGGSSFGAASHHSRSQRNGSFVDPLEAVHEEQGLVAIHVTEEPDSKSSQGHIERNTTLDGTVETKLPRSRAELWSDAYQACLTPGQAIGYNSDAPFRAQPGTSASSTMNMMGPPSLKPMKARSPEHATGLDSSAIVRRFPSATVIDDRKGHSRSVSLLSVKIGPDGVMRESTNDLIEMIQSREREERDRLLRGPSRASAATGEDA